jgi:nicotinamide-nucleotide amidase
LPRPTDPQAALITIGNEILLGKTLNTNMAFLGSRLAALGIPVVNAQIVQDDPQAICKALAEAWQKYDVVITTGGLGPTEDDLTKATIAEFFGKGQHFDEEVWIHVQSLFSRRGLPTPDINRCQAMVPDGFAVLRTIGEQPPPAYEKDEKHFFAQQVFP